MFLTDADQVRNLLGEYCRAIDAGDFARVGELFSEATLHGPDGQVLAHGRDQVEALYRATTRRHEDGTPRTQHLITGSIIAEPAADGTVQVDSTYVVLQATDDLALQPIITGGYLDRFGRRGDRWCYLERHFRIGLVGRLDHHLHPSTGAPS